MANLILDDRDQKFVLYEMLGIEKLCKNPLYAEFSKDVFNMILIEAQKFATEEIFPTLAKGDKEGCKLEDGQVYVPKVFHRPYRLACEAGWNSMTVPPEHGGQGLPVIMRTAAHEWFMHNFGFYCYIGSVEGAAQLIEVYGTEEQKKKYMQKMITGQWGGTMVLTEPNAGSDVGNLSTKAIRQLDGTFKLKGTKIFITCGDSDLVENIIHPVLARIEGDPPGTKGISIFLVPKYLVNHPTPVLPAVASMMVPPGLNSPRRSASSIIASPIRSFTLPPGLKYSTFASIVTGRPSVTLESLTKGVLPIASNTF